MLNINILGNSKKNNFVEKLLFRNILYISPNRLSILSIVFHIDITILN